MRRVRNCLIALLLGLSTPILIWVGAGTALYQRGKQAKALENALRDLTCAINADCPPGYVCVGGYCVPQNAR